MLSKKHLLIFTLLLATTACAKKPVVDKASIPGARSGGGASEALPSDRSGMSSSQVIETVASDGQVAAPGTDAGMGIDLQNGGKFETIYFDYDSFLLTADARQVLEKNARLMRTNSAAKIVIKGHTDERGSDAYNLALGERRAKAAYDYLAALGVPAVRLSVTSYGEEQPAAEGHDEASWARNRRAEF